MFGVQRFLLAYMAFAPCLGWGSYYAVDWGPVVDIQIQDYMGVCPGANSSLASTLVWKSHADERFLLTTILGGGAISYEISAIALPNRMGGLSGWQIDSLGIEVLFQELNYLLRTGVTSGDTTAMDSVQARLLDTAKIDTAVETLEWRYYSNKIYISSPEWTPNSCVDSLYGDSALAMKFLPSAKSGLGISREGSQTWLLLPAGMRELTLVWIAADGRRIATQHLELRAEGRVLLDAPPNATALLVSSNGLTSVLPLSHYRNGRK